jgi:hypothetical protein
VVNWQVTFPKRHFSRLDRQALSGTQKPYGHRLLGGEKLNKHQELGPKNYKKGVSSTWPYVQA